MQMKWEGGAPFFETLDRLHGHGLNILNGAMEEAQENKTWAYFIVQVNNILVLKKTTKYYSQTLTFRSDIDSQELIKGRHTAAHYTASIQKQCSAQSAAAGLFSRPMRTPNYWCQCTFSA